MKGEEGEADKTTPPSSFIYPGISRAFFFFSGPSLRESDRNYNYFLEGAFRNFHEDLVLSATWIRRIRAGRLRLGEL
jgi:hypothetical protein